jgi:cell division protein FtsB
MSRFFSSLIKILSISLLVYFLFGITVGIYENKKDIKRLKAKVVEKEEENKKLQEKEKEMLKRIDNLKDPAEIEKIAREVLNMRKPEEEIYRIIKN